MDLSYNYPLDSIQPTYRANLYHSTIHIEIPVKILILREPHGVPTLFLVVPGEPTGKLPEVTVGPITHRSDRLLLLAVRRAPHLQCRFYMPDRSTNDEAINGTIVNDRANDSSLNDSEW